LWIHLMNYYVRWGKRFFCGCLPPIISIGFDRKEQKILVSPVYLLKMNTPLVGTILPACTVY
jgi:hypothetical protein